MFPSAELASLRAEAERFLPDTCTVQTVTHTNTKGSVVSAYANTYTSVPCRLAAVGSGAERVIGEELSAETTHVLTVAYGQAVAPSDRIVHAGATYEVTACPNTLASWRTARRVYLKRVVVNESTTPPVTYAPALDFSDYRNSMYLAVL